MTATRLTPTARGLQRLLEREGRRYGTATNEQLAAVLGVTTRSVTTALTRLVAAGVVVVDIRRGHPTCDPSARTIRLAAEEVQP